MARRRIPWFVVVILLGIWAHGIYRDRVGGNSKRQPENTLEASLTYLDRSLRTEEKSSGDHDFLRWVLDDSEPSETLVEARDSLEGFEEEDLLDAEGRRALAVIREEMKTPQEDLSKLDDLTRAVLEDDEVPPGMAAPLIEKLNSGEGAWWDEKIAGRLLLEQPDKALADALATQQKQDRKIFIRSAVAFGLVSFLSIIGLFWLPHLIRVIRSGWTAASLHRPVRYGSCWEPSFVIALFLAADLLAGYFCEGAYFATSWIQTGFVFDVGIDTLWRLFAPGLALVILFRKPRHAIRSLGLNTVPSWRVVLAGFAVLSWLNYGFNVITAPWMDFDPTGGLDLMEKGWGGLFYGLLSACLIAPIAEETFYRGLLLRGLERRFGFWISASVVTLAFALGHYYDVFGMISVGMLGFLMVVIYRTTGSLTTVIALHALYNLTITLPQWLLYYSKF